MEEVKKVKVSEVTPEMIEAWKTAGKRKIAKVSFAINEDDLEGSGQQAEFIVCQPSRNLLDIGAKYSREGNIRKANNVFIANCVLAGDLEFIKPDTDSYMVEVELSLLDEIGKLVEAKKATVKKL